MVTLYQETNDGKGRIVLWVTFGLMAGSAILFAALGATRTWKLRSHSVLSTAICAIAAAAYYALATNQGRTPILIGDGSSGVTRDVFYARYIDWTFTTPLLLMDVLLIAGVPFGTLLWVVFSDIMMIVLGLFGAVTVGKFKWGWFGIACLFQLLIMYGLLVVGVRSVGVRHNQLKGYYIAYAGSLSLLWLGYPIVWGLAEGSNSITAMAEAGSYAGLDIAAKVIFSWLLMLIVSPLRNLQESEEAAAGGRYVYPLLTPCNDVWGNPVVDPDTKAAPATADP